MSKKYVPSGYQIFDIYKDSNGDVLESEDCKLLMEIIKNKKFDKPLLIHVKDEYNNVEITSFFTVFNDELFASYYDAGNTESRFCIIHMPSELLEIDIQSM